MQASEPPQIATSASPARMRRAASPIACTLAAQAVTGVPIGPLKPWRIEIWPAARFARKDGTVKGERRLTPRWSVVRTASTIAGKPPMPDAITVAVPSMDCASEGAHAACAMASDVAARANRMKRSILR